MQNLKIDFDVWVLHKKTLRYRITPLKNDKNGYFELSYDSIDYHFDSQLFKIDKSEINEIKLIRAKIRDPLIFAIPFPFVFGVFAIFYNNIYQSLYMFGLVLLLFIIALRIYWIKITVIGNKGKIVDYYFADGKFAGIKGNFGGPRHFLIF